MFNLIKNQLRATTRAYKTDTAGNFAIIAAVSMTAVLGAIGAGIDISGASSERSRLQDLTDSAALAAAASGETEEAELRDIVDHMMAVQAADHREFTYNLTVVDDVVTVTANSDYETSIMGMFGYKTLPISTQSGSMLPGSTAVTLSLVVDTTDSMEGDKLAALQDAAGELVKIIKETKDIGSQMAVVPFGDYVNVGLDNRNAQWMDVPNDYTETQACYMTRPEKSRSNCREETRTRYNDGVPYGHRREVCDIEYEDFEIEVCPDSYEVEWRGCAGSRNDPLNMEPAAGMSTQIPGVMNETCGSELLPLTDDFGDVESLIDGLSTRGDTYLPTGLLWGWRSLNESAPYSVAPADDETARAIVFMTDGGNTMEPYDKDGTGDDAYHGVIKPNDKKNEDARDRLMSICDGIKGDNIILYTIAYDLHPSAQGTAADLMSCATSSDTAFSADNAKDLEEAFKDIGNSLTTSVRLTF